MSIGVRWIDGTPLGSIANGRLSLASRSAAWLVDEALPYLREHMDAEISTDHGIKTAAWLIEEIGDGTTVREPLTDAEWRNTLRGYGWLP